MPKPVFAFDLDFTLVLHNEQEGIQNWLSLTQSTPHNTAFGVYHVVFPEKMSVLFSSLLQEECTILFISASTYEKAIMLPLLERAYQLPANCLAASQFYNRFDYEGMTKGTFLYRLQICDRIEWGAKLVFVDDFPSNLEGARIFGFDTVLATIDNSNYIDQITAKLDHYLAKKEAEQDPWHELDKYLLEQNAIQSLLWMKNAEKPAAFSAVGAGPCAGPGNIRPPIL